MWWTAVGVARIYGSYFICLGGLLFIPLLLLFRVMFTRANCS